MWLATYSDKYHDYVSLGKTRKEAEQNMYATLVRNKGRDEALEGFDSVEDFIDSEINVYKINSGETMVLGYGIRFNKDGEVV